MHLKKSKPHVVEPAYSKTEPCVASRRAIESSLLKPRMTQHNSDYLSLAEDRTVSRASGFDVVT